MATPPTPPRLSERDVSYLKLLKTLKQAPSVTEGALGVVRRIADWIDSLAVLNFICSHQPWLDDWGVKEALVHNDRTPARHRVELEKAIAIFDLLREMDAPGLSAQERAEIQEDIKYLFKTLPEHDRPIVKQHAYALSATRTGKAPKARVATPEDDEAIDAATAALLAGEDESAELDADDVPLPAPSGFAPLEIEPAAAPSGFAPLEIEPAAAPAGFAPVSADAAASAAPDGTPTQGGTTDMLRVAEQEALAAANEAAVSAAEDEAAEEDSAEATVAQAAGARLAGMDRGAKVTAARATPDAEMLGLLVFDQDDEVALALLENPALTDRLASTVARRASQRVAAEIYRKRAIFMRPLVRQALLECPNAPSAALLEVVNSVSDINELLRILRSPKVKFLEVKAKARARMAMIFKSLGQNEKIAAIRRAGSFLLKELWTDFFRDEALVVRCVQEKQVEANIVLEIARSKIAPRRALEVIGTTAQYTANYQICLELVLNPKTPRQVVTTLIRKLNPSDRKMVKNNPALPQSIRNFA